MRRHRPDDLPSDCEEWMKKCFFCKHSGMTGGNNPYYTGYWYCTLKTGCRYEPDDGGKKKQEEER